MSILLFLKDLLWEAEISKSIWVFCELYLKLLLTFVNHPAWNLFIFITCYRSVQIRKSAEQSVTTNIIWKICPSSAVVLNVNANNTIERFFFFSMYVCIFSLLTDVIND